MAAYDFWWKEKDHMPEDWTEAAFHGNGVLGSMVYFRQTAKGRFLHVELGSRDVYDRRISRDFWMAKQFDNPRLPIGSMEYFCPGKILDFYMHTNLYDAVSELYLRTEYEEIKCNFYVCAQEQMIVIEQEKGSISKWDFLSRDAVSPRQTYGILKDEKERVDKDYWYNLKPGVKRNGEEIYCIWELVNDFRTITVCHYDTSENRIFIKIEQEQHLQEQCVSERLWQDRKQDYYQRHLKWWHDYYPISSLDIPDSGLEAFYWRQIYKLGSAVRENSRVLDNQGPWLFITPWPGTWWNLNVQLCYWPLYTSNRLEQAASLNHYLLKYQDDLIENVPPQYRYDSSGIGTNTTWNLQSKIADPQEDNGEQFVELGNLTWALHNCWLFYRMSMDRKLLCELIYPLLKRSINYYLHFVRKGEDGRLHLPPTNSPEYGKKCEDCNYDLSLLRWGCETLQKCVKILEIKDEKEKIWRDICENLVDYPENETGYLIGRNLPYERTHRHFSHLIMHVPLYLVNREKSDSQRLMERSLRHWFSYQGDIMGFSYVGASLLCSSYKKGDEALAYLDRLLKEHVTYNTMYQEAGPVMETPLAAAECIQQLLLQSWGGKIRIFPSVPGTWKHASFCGFAAEGGFKVSASYENGETAWIEIESIVGEECRIETDMKSARVLYTDGSVGKLDISGWCRLEVPAGTKVRLDKSQP